MLRTLIALLAASAFFLAAPVIRVRCISVPHIQEQIPGPLVDDARHYLRPGITPTELLRARGYLAHEHSMETSDGHILSLVRGTNPLVNGGARGLDSKQPILFINGATLSTASYLVNSRNVRPRLHEIKRAAEMDVREFKRQLNSDPAAKSLPFLALNLGYECWFLNRRGFTGSRRKRSHAKRTLADAWRSMPKALLGNVLDGFTLDANLKHGRPVRTKTHALDPKTINHNETIHFEAGRAEKKPHDLKSSDRAKGARSLSHLLLPVPLQAGLNLLQLMILLTKLPGTLKRMGDAKLEFIETFDPEFWHFSLDEQAEIDLPEAIEYVLKKTGKRKLNTVGLSCGGALVLMALAERPELAHKVSRAVLWAPSVNLGSKSDSVYQLSKTVPMLQGYTGPVPFVFLTREVQYLLQKICSLDIMQRTICAAFMDVMGGFSNGQSPLRPSMIATIMEPTGIHELTQLAQMAHTQNPCKFSFNTKRKNVEFYGTPEPPCYDLSRIGLRNISFYVGAHDTLVSPDDIATTELQMRVPSELHIIKGEHIYFNHFGPLLHQNNEDLAIIPSLLDMERSQAEACGESFKFHSDD